MENRYSLIGESQIYVTYLCHFNFRINGKKWATHLLN
jgi:hypothetical protein